MDIPSISLIRLASTLGGIPLLECLPDSPAHRAGVRYGDILLELNGQRVRTVEEYVEARLLDSLGMTLAVHRDGETITFVLEFEAPQPNVYVSSYPSMLN